MRMKRFLLAVLLMVSLITIVQGQATVGIGSKYAFKDSVELGKPSVLYLYYYAKNVGNSSYTGMIRSWVKTPKMTFKSDSAYLLDFSPGDSQRLWVVIPNNSKYLNVGNNIIVVWPEGTKIQTRDTINWSLKVYQLSGITPDKNAHARVSLYPNPVGDNIFIENFAEVKIKDVLLYDMTGKELKVIVKDGGHIDVSNLPAGSYTIIIQFRDGMDERFKVIKEK